MRGPKIDSILSDRNTWPFSGPGGSSRGIETGDLQETAVRTLWDLPGAQNRQIWVKIPKLPGYRAKMR